MPPLPGKRDPKFQSLKTIPTIGQGKDQHSRRSQASSSTLTGVRNKQGGGGELTPTKSKSDAEPPDEVVRLGTPTSLQRPKSREAPQVKDSREDYIREDNVSHRKWARDRRTESKASISSLDGPILVPRPSRVSSLSVSHSANSEISRTSYAQAASYARPARQFNSIQVSPRSIINTTSLQVDRSIELAHRPSPSATRLESEETFSTVATSVFDKSDVEDGGSLSDYETNVSSFSSYPQSLPPELDLDDRLIKPDHYFSNLEELEANIVGNSALFLLRERIRQDYPKESHFAFKFGFESYCSHTNEDPQTSWDTLVLDYCKSNKSFGPAARSQSAETISADLGYWAFHLLECRNVMLAVTSNLRRMQDENYVNSFISILVTDANRANVVNLLKVEIIQIINLHHALEAGLLQLVPLLQSSRPQRSSRIHDLREKITLQCERILDHLKLPHGDTAAGKWRRTALLLDLAITSYSGAHQESFDERFLGQDLNLAQLTPAWTYDTSGRSTIMMRRRRLRCLDKLLRTPVWVFQDSKQWEEDTDLYLSTQMDTFADIWGPSWEIRKKSSDCNILGYKVGLGSIVPWSSEENAPPLLQGELFCHWTEDTPDLREAPRLFERLSQLLIGASTMTEQTTSQLKENPLCSTRTGEIVQLLRSTHRVEEMGTSAEERYLAEECVTASFGYSGIALGGQRTYKRRCGVLLKQAICEEWQNNSSSRNPAILEHYIGLEVSFCSGNARRRRLKDIFNTRTVLYWLESCKSNVFPMDCEDAFHQALESEDPRAFRVLWCQHREWRQDLGRLVSWCLEGLAKSKVDTEGSLHVLWMPREDKRLMVKMKQNHGYAWTSFLTDTRSHCTMAIMSCKCLHSDYKYASLCKKKTTGGEKSGYSVLETALVINPKASRPKNMELKQSQNEKIKLPRYSISRLQSGDRFPVPGGRLQVREVFAHTRLLVEWEKGVTRKLYDYKQSMSKSVGVESFYHWELRDDEDSATKPVPLLLISQNRDKI